MANKIRTEEDRKQLARKRLLSVLGTHTVALMRTLENKISDAGPANQRIDPHVLTMVRNALVESGDLVRVDRQGAPWYHRQDADQAAVERRIAQLSAIHRQFNSLSQRIGQSLEIAIFRALRAQSMVFFGNFPTLEEHDDSRLYSKLDELSAVGSRSLPGDMRLDFILMHPVAGTVGIEAKNIREWLYPDRDEIRELLLKCTAIDAVPVLVARRIQFATFRLLSRCGVVLHEQFNQLVPSTAQAIADQARHKALLGYHDIRLGNMPDARLLKFIQVNLPAALPDARLRFDRYYDLLRDYGTGAIGYAEFAARVRRRHHGTNEDSDFSPD